MKIEYSKLFKMIDELVKESLSQHANASNPAVKAAAMARASVLRGLVRMLESERKLASFEQQVN